MKWVEKARILLTKAFETKTFRAADAVGTLKKAVGLKPGSTYRILFELEKNAEIEKLGRGIYRLGPMNERKAKPTVPEFVKRLALKLEKKGVRAQITGLPILLNYINLVPRRIIYLVYAPHGAGEQAIEILGSRKRFALLNPTLNEINAVLSTAGGKDVAVIRENSAFHEGIESTATVEKALVDFYFEVSRKKIPFPKNEAERIISEVITSTRIDVTKLFKAASKRGIRKEIEAKTYSKKPETKILTTIRGI